MALAVPRPLLEEYSLENRSVLDGADSFRRAGMAFVTRSRRWERRDLVEWLALHHSLAEWNTRDSEPPSTGRRRTPVSSDHLREWVGEALELVEARLASLRVPEEAHRFGVEAVRSGLVMPTSDALGRCGFCPRGQRGMSLGERVVSLFAADYLMRPGDYDRLMQCGGCRKFMFVDRRLVGGAAPRCRSCVKAPTLRWRNAVMGVRPENDQDP